MSRIKSKTSRFLTFATASVLFAASSLMAIHGEARGDTSATATAKATFQARCAMCHGPDGAGSAVGKTMNIPDLRSQTTQKTPDSQLAAAIANGKNGMPSFKGSLNAEQIHGLVVYIHTLAAKK